LQSCRRSCYKTLKALLIILVRLRLIAVLAVQAALRPLKTSLTITAALRQLLKAKSLSWLVTNLKEAANFNVIYYYYSYTN